MFVFTSVFTNNTTPYSSPLTSQPFIKQIVKRKCKNYCRLSTWCIALTLLFHKIKSDRNKRSTFKPFIQDMCVGFLRAGRVTSHCSCYVWGLWSAIGHKAMYGFYNLLMVMLCVRPEPTIGHAMCMACNLLLVMLQVGSACNLL